MLPFLIPWLLIALTPLIEAQVTNSFPHEYEGIPNKDSIYNSSNRVQWQNYYRVDVTALPNATQCTMPSGYAGNIPVNRPEIKNDTLFAWALENSPGSLTDESSDAPWAIWLNGGPGSSSMIGLFQEHGPCLQVNNFSLVPNSFALTTLMDTVYLDQPVGTGYATASAKGFVVDEDQMAEDFMGFLTNLVTIFPRLQQRPLYLMGESYAGTYIPYITKAYFGMENPPVTLKHLVIGDGTIMTIDASSGITMVPYLETYPQIIDYDFQVYQYFRQQTRLCGYDLNITFPQMGPLPTVRTAFSDEDSVFAKTARRSRKNMDIFRQMGKAGKFRTALSKRDVLSEEERKREFDEKVRSLKRGVLPEEQKPESREHDKRASPADFSGRGNATTIDPWYECDLLDEVIDWAVNFTKPWSLGESSSGFDVYNLPDALIPEAPMSNPANIGSFLNDPRTAAAIHAPKKPWLDSIAYPYNNSLDIPPGANEDGDISPPVVLFLSELATNASQRDVGITFLSGQDDFLLSTYGTIAAIQNFTFGGIQGFTQVPSTEWFVDGTTAGIVHQERNITLAIFTNAGHLLSQRQPVAYKSFIKEFVLNRNINGTLDASGKFIGEQNPLGHALNPPAEHDAIFTGSGTTMGSTIWPSATIASWDNALAQLISTPAATSLLLPKSGSTPLISTIPLKSLISLLVIGGLMII